MARLLPALSIAAGLMVAPAAFADRSEDIERLGEALGLPDIIEIMRAEGLGHGADLEDEMFPGQGGETWRRVVSDIYDAERMQATVEQHLEDGLDGVDLDPLFDFFSSARGEEIIGYEISARQALMDEEVEAAAEEAYAVMRDTGDARLELIADFVEANDLVGSNVMGAMNSNYAFYLGLADGDALPSSMTEGDIINEVWAQEEDIRIDTENWVYSYLAMAYEPLEDADLEAYIAISKTEEGKALNRALFSGFDEMYNAISRALGSAAGRAMLSQDI